MTEKQAVSLAIKIAGVWIVLKVIAFGVPMLGWMSASLFHEPMKIVSVISLLLAILAMCVFAWIIALLLRGSDRIAGLSGASDTPLAATGLTVSPGIYTVACVVLGCWLLFMPVFANVMRLVATPVTLFSSSVTPEMAARLTRDNWFVLLRTVIQLAVAFAVILRAKAIGQFLYRCHHGESELPETEGGAL